MFKIQGKNIQMNQGDFGLPLPMIISNILEDDTLKFEIYDPNKTKIMEKNLLYRDGKYVFELTKEETKQLTEKTYMYKIVQYRGSVMQNTINEDSLFEVI